MRESDKLRRDWNGRRKEEGLPFLVACLLAAVLSWPLFLISCCWLWLVVVVVLGFWGQAFLG